MASPGPTRHFTSNAFCPCTDSKLKLSSFDHWNTEKLSKVRKPEISEVNDLPNFSSAGLLALSDVESNLHTL